MVIGECDRGSLGGLAPSRLASFDHACPTFTTHMKILVANLGSTSFKYRLFDMADERVLARGGVERIGSDEARCFVEVGGKRTEATLAAPDHAVAVRLCLQQLADPTLRCLQDPSELAAIGFKTVHAH